MFGHARMISVGFGSFFSSVNMILKNNGEYIRWSFSIGYCERYVNSKSDYLELLLSVYSSNTVMHSISVYRQIQISVAVTCVLYTSYVIEYKLGRKEFWVFLVCFMLLKRKNGKNRKFGIFKNV